MHLALLRHALAALAAMLPAIAWAGPPALPEGEPQPDAAPQAAPDPGAAPPASTEPEPAPEADADAMTPPSGADPGGPPALEMSGDVDAGAEVSPAGTEMSIDAASDGEAVASGADDDDPGNVRGRREGLMPTNRGAIGLFHTTLPDAGGRYTVRFRVHTDFFRDSDFIFEGDTQARVRGGLALGFSPFEWGEIFFSVNNSANRNERAQRGRQDPVAVFALGDMDFGIKGAHRFEKYGIGVGGQAGLGLLSSSERLLTSNVNFWFDGLFAVDIRYLTKNQFPFRFTTNIGWMLDNSLRVADYAAITDPISREVTRFNLGGNHNRLRMRYAVDFPVRLGKERQFGIDPILEWAWDISTTEEPAFARPDAVDSPLPRSSQWLTIGVRANVVSGLHIDAAADVGLVSPNFEFGPPVAPWQIILGLGWSFDPNPVVKEVPVEVDQPPPPPEPVLEGRIVGRVLDPQGNPVSDARVEFPGLVSGAIVTDASGNFTSYRFPAGSVPVQVVMNGEVVAESSAQIVDNQDTELTIQLESMPAPATGVVSGAFVDEQGSPVKVRMQVVGQGVDEGFDANESGLILLELYAGDYRATLSAPGYVDKTITFTIPEEGDVKLQETLQRDQPPETPRVIPRGNSIRLRERIRYQGNDLSPASHDILDELATFLKYHPEYEVIEIGVHTDDRGAAKQRTDQRAEAVKGYLVSKGISPTRIETRGYGASKPIAVNLTAAGRAKNNRTIIGVKKKSE